MCDMENKLFFENIKFFWIINVQTKILQISFWIFWFLQFKLLQMCSFQKVSATIDKNTISIRIGIAYLLNSEKLN